MELVQGMTALHNHADLELMLRPRRATEEGILDQYHPYVVVCFSAKWCGPCRRIDKASLVQKAPSVKWFHCDVDVNEISLGYCGGRSIPAFVLIRDGTFVGRLEGPRDAQHVLEWIKEYGAQVQ